MLNGFTNKSTFKGKRKYLMTHTKTLISLFYFVIKCYKQNIQPKPYLLMVDFVFLFNQLVSLKFYLLMIFLVLLNPVQFFLSKCYKLSTLILLD